nr:Dihydrofolate reductase [uncultured bacterium]
MKVSIIVAMTADGYIGRTTDHLATTWTNIEDKYLFTHYVKEAGNMVMGLNTFKTTAEKFPGVFNKSMPGRRLLVYTPDPEEVTKYANVEAVTESPEKLVKRLEKEGVKHLAVCGGTTIYTMFMQSGLVQDIYVDMQATLFGAGMPFLNASVDAQIELKDIKRLGDNNVLLHYAVKK